MKKHNIFFIFIFFWVFVTLITKGFTLTEEIVYCFDKLEGAPHERCPECGLSREIYDNQTFLERYITEAVWAFAFFEMFILWFTFDPAIPLLEMFDPESPWTYEILRDYVNNGHLYNDFFKWIEYFYPKDPEK